MTSWVSFKQMECVALASLWKLGPLRLRAVQSDRAFLGGTGRHLSKPRTVVLGHSQPSLRDCSCGRGRRTAQRKRGGTGYLESVLDRGDFAIDDRDVVSVRFLADGSKLAFPAVGVKTQPSENPILSQRGAHAYQRQNHGDRYYPPERLPLHEIPPILKRKATIEHLSG
jgi:hypothetical protein